MALCLRIDNMDTLPDGGPVSYEIDRRGIDIGRDPYLDWTLPDPERYISGKHCEIRYRDGGYWLHDVSTNGTTLNGQAGRLTEPHRLEDGDRIHIGTYIIAVTISGEDTAETGADAAPAGAARAPDPWAAVDDVAAPVDRRDFAAHALTAKNGAPSPGPTDLSEENISWSVGRITEGEASTDDDIWGVAPSGEPAMDGAGSPADALGWPPPVAPGAGAPPASPPAGRVPPTEPEARRETPPEMPPETPAPAAAPVQADPFANIAAGAAPRPDDAPRPAPPPPSPPPPAEPGPDVAPPAGDAAGVPDPAPARAASPAPESPAPEGRADAPLPAGAGAFIAAFERGAGIPPGSVAGRDDAALAEELGALFGLVARNLQAMLAARAETKSAMRSSDRTMIGALENNPLKFSPTVEDALRIMFGARTKSYLDATATVESSFLDLQKHQLQTFAAMQRALQALIEDLDPQSIEAATSRDGGLAGMVGSRRAKCWDTYAERFKAKSARHERGMVDAFMILFAEAYDHQR